MLFGQALGHQLRHLRGNGRRIQIDEFQTQLRHQSIDNLAFSDDMTVPQHIAQPLAVFLLDGQGLLELLLGNGPAAHQQVAQSCVFHILPPSPRSPLRQRTEKLVA